MITCYNLLWATVILFIICVAASKFLYYDHYYDMTDANNQILIDEIILLKGYPMCPSAGL